MYSTDNEVAKEVCRTLGFIFQARFVEAARRGGKTYVRGTLGKPDEFRALRAACREHGYIYTGLNRRRAK